MFFLVVVVKPLVISSVPTALIGLELRFGHEARGVQISQPLTIQAVQVAQFIDVLKVGFGIGAFPARYVLISFGNRVAIARHTDESIVSHNDFPFCTQGVCVC